MKAHWVYLKYVLRHKWFVLKACQELKVSWWQALTHDLSKFLPLEWGGYVYSYYFEDGSKKKKEERTWWEKSCFDKAWLRHLQSNPHHWEYWCLVGNKGKVRPLRMPYRYIEEMVADWLAMGLSFGKNDLVKYYDKNKDKILLDPWVRCRVEVLVRIHGTTKD